VSGDKVDEEPAAATFAINDEVLAAANALANHNDEELANAFAANDEEFDAVANAFANNDEVLADANDNELDAIANAFAATKDTHIVPKKFTVKENTKDTHIVPKTVNKKFALKKENTKDTHIVPKKNKTAVSKKTGVEFITSKSDQIAEECSSREP
jgi:hypothetical protein